MEFFDSLKVSIDNFLYSPFMIGVQVFSIVFSIGLIIFRGKMIRETSDLHRPAGEMWGAWFVNKDKKKDNKKDKADEDDLNFSGLRKQWADIEKKMDTHDEAKWKIGIIESDNLLDEALKQMGIQGSSLGERLKSMDVNHYPFVNDAWKAHRVRNYLVHDSSYRISARTVGETHSHYRNVFTDMGIVENG